MKPLERIEKSAIAIGDGQFVTIEPLPWTKEVKSVAVALNLMSAKIENVIRSLQAKLGEAERKLTTDSVTGLETKQTFDTSLKQFFISGTKGYIFLQSIDDLTGFSRSKSREDVDEFLKRFATCLQQSGIEGVKAGSYRLSGSEFAILIKSANREQAEQFCQTLTDNLEELGKRSGKNNIANIGGVAIDLLGSSTSIMSAALESYNKAKLVGPNSYIIGESNNILQSKEQWETVTQEIVKEERVEVVFSDRAESIQGDSPGKILLEEATARVFDAEKNELPIGTFISVAEELNLGTVFDLLVLEKVLRHVHSENIEHDIAVNLSYSSIADLGFRSKLYNIIQSKEKNPGKLVFCLTAYSAARDLKILASFKDLIQRSGAKLMIKRYEPRFMDLDVMKEFGFSYIRLARSFTEEIAGDDEKQRFVSTMVETGSMLGATILAESVSDKDWDTVMALGIPGASRGAGHQQR